MNSAGNGGFGTTSPPTAGGPAFALGQGTQPTGIGGNTAGIWAQDVAGTAELMGFDEAGNDVQLTPHPTDFLNTLPLANYPYPWAYSAKNIYIGKKINVDMAGLVMAVEKLSRQTFTYVTNIPAQDWDIIQSERVAARREQIVQLTSRVNVLTQKILAESDPIKKDALLQQQKDIIIPQEYIPKSMPKWMKERLVK